MSPAGRLLVPLGVVEVDTKEPLSAIEEVGFGVAEVVARANALEDWAELLRGETPRLGTDARVVFADDAGAVPVIVGSEPLEPNTEPEGKIPLEAVPEGMRPLEADPVG